MMGLLPMIHEQRKRRTSTLSISLPPELAGAISERVQSGLYTSASELIREALRLLLKVEEAQRAQLERLSLDAADADRSSAATRFATMMQLFDLGVAIRGEKALRGEPGLAGKEARDRLRQWEEEQETGPGLRISPERLAKLKLRE